MRKNAQRPLVDSFSVAQAARLSGLTLSMVNYLCRYDVVVPSASGERGRGRRRAFTYRDVLLLRVLSQLLKQGVSVLGLRRSLVAYRERGASKTGIESCRYFVTDGYNVYFQDGGRLEDLSSGQRAFAFVLDMKPVRDALQKEIGRVHRTGNA
ncbi:MerR family transcriptional regulator [Burkholderia vietnamiensis]|uniref:MerR family transcriptional regulator n=1 Tax=Burkholderia vietnamiensis TaxID=60552 RepID=UPI0032FA1CCF|nr:MerR family transcriptional regulator [Burkholderia vietnamiensis]